MLSFLDILRLDLLSFNKRYQIHLTLYHRQSKALSCNKGSSCSWERPCYVDSAIRNYKHLFGLSIHCKSIPNCSQLTRRRYLNRECHTRMKPIFPHTTNKTDTHPIKFLFIMDCCFPHMCSIQYLLPI